MAEGDRDDAPAILNGWKEIAVFLGKSVRSVQRWERDLGLPVRRINTPDRGQIVYASRSEIEQWRQRMDRRAVSLDETDSPKPPDANDDSRPARTPTPEPISAPVVSSEAAKVATPWKRRVATAVALVATLLAGVFIGRWTITLDRVPDRLNFAGTAIEAVGRGGHVLWRHDFGESAGRPDVTGADVTKVDLDNDGSLEFIVPVRYGPHPTNRPSKSDEVFCFRRDGAIVWRASPRQQVTQGQRAFDGPWYFRSIISPGTVAGGRTWIAFSHHIWSPAVVLEMGREGEERVRFVQDGSVTSLAYWTTPKGAMLAAGGVHNGQQQAAVAVISADGAPAQAPTGPERRLECGKCPSDGPAAFFLLPTSEVAAASGALYSMVVGLAATDSGLSVATDDNQIGLISPDLQFESLEYGDNYWAAHRRLEQERKIDHPSDRCPWRLEPREVRAWHAGRGWLSHQIPPGSSRAGGSP